MKDMFDRRPSITRRQTVSASAVVLVLMAAVAVLAIDKPFYPDTSNICGGYSGDAVWQYSMPSIDTHKHRIVCSGIEDESGWLRSNWEYCQVGGFDTGNITVQSFFEIVGSQTDSGNGLVKTRAKMRVVRTDNGGTYYKTGAWHTGPWSGTGDGYIQLTLVISDDNRWFKKYDVTTWVESRAYSYGWSDYAEIDWYNSGGYIKQSHIRLYG
jgi:hypothetical protein